MIPAPEQQPTLTIDETARILGISRSTAYEAAKAGTLPTLRLGRRLVVPVTRLRHMLGLDAELAPRGDDLYSDDAA